MKRTWKVTGIALGLIVLLGVVSVVLTNHLKQVKEQTVRAGFTNLLTQEEVTAAEVSKYIDTHLDAVSAKTAAQFVLALEQVQQEALPAWQERYDDLELQEQIRPFYHRGWTREEMALIRDTDLRAVLLSTLEQGFKVETAEGTFFPVIDYTFYQQYQAAVTPDLSAYLDLMAVESEQTPVKDAALMIGWDEIVKRAWRQEEFLNEYSSSTQIQPVRELLKRYQIFALFGCNNTPLFSYESKQMKPEAKQAYLANQWVSENGDFSAVMIEYLKILAANDYRLTGEVDAFRKKAVGFTQ